MMKPVFTVVLSLVQGMEEITLKHFKGGIYSYLFNTTIESIKSVSFQVIP
jgi:hypothetical protein